MKLSRKLFSATAALGLAVLATVGSTYAWFSVNDKVEVTGMSATTQVSNNLLISGTTDEADFTSGPLNQSRVGKLRPASTANGTSFFYTVNAKADGDAASDAYVAYNEAQAQAHTEAGKTAYDLAFQKAYKITTKEDNAEAIADINTTKVVYGYIDYTFYLKATSVADNQTIALTVCTLTDNEDDDAWRVALLATNPQTTAAATESAELNLMSVLGTADAEYQELESTTPKGVNSTTTLGAVTNWSTAAKVDDGIDNLEVSYYRVVVRLWLEGEDKTCTNSTYVNLSSAHALNLKFEIGTQAGVTEIGIPA